MYIATYEYVINKHEPIPNPYSSLTNLFHDIKLFLNLESKLIFVSKIILLKLDQN